MHKGDLERGMLKRWPTLDITCSNWYQVQAQVDKVKSHFNQSGRDHIAGLYNLHHFKSDAERLDSIDALLEENKYLFPVAERVEGGVHGPNPIQRVSKAANKWPESTLLPGDSVSNGSGSGFGPQKRVGSVPEPAKNPTLRLFAGQTRTRTRQPAGFARFG